MVMAVAVSGAKRQPPSPVLWLHPNGTVLVAGAGAPARQTRGAQTVQTPFGLGLDLDGAHGGLLLQDLPALALTKSMTVSTWVYLRSYVNAGPGAQILFRGDDRSGFDPYDLVIGADGTVAFGICEANGNTAYVATEIPLKAWVRVTGSFDADSGEIRLWLNDRLLATRFTARRPFAALDSGWAPGIGIGNVQNDLGPHNQPLNGTITDLRLYPEVLDPADAGWRPY